MRFWPAFIFFLLSAAVFGDGVVTGSVTDGEANEVWGDHGYAKIGDTGASDNSLFITATSADNGDIQSFTLSNLPNYIWRVGQTVLHVSVHNHASNPDATLDVRFRAGAYTSDWTTIEPTTTKAIHSTVIEGDWTREQLDGAEIDLRPADIGAGGMFIHYAYQENTESYGV